jgi:hypothetical protein
MCPGGTPSALEQLNVTEHHDLIAANLINTFPPREQKDDAGFRTQDIAGLVGVADGICPLLPSAGIPDDAAEGDWLLPRRMLGYFLPIAHCCPHPKCKGLTTRCGE